MLLDLNGAQIASLGPSPRPLGYAPGDQVGDHSAERIHPHYVPGVLELLPKTGRTPWSPCKPVTSHPALLRGYSASVGGSSALTLVGDIDLVTEDTLDELLTQAETAGPNLVVDVGRVAFMGVAGVNVLLAHHARLARGGGRLILRSPTPLIQRVLDVLNLSDVLTVEDKGSRAVGAHRR